MITQEAEKTTHTKENKSANFEADCKKWEAKLEDVNKRISRISDDTKSSGKPDQKKGIKDLKAKYGIAQKKLAEFTASGGNKGEHFTGEMETLLKDFEVTFKKLTH